MKEVKIQHAIQIPTDDPEYVRLVSLISELWENAKSKAVRVISYISQTEMSYKRS